MRSKSILLTLVFIKAVFAVGTAEMKGPSLTLHTAVREYNQINWMFGPQNWPIASCRVNETPQCEIRLQTDEQINTFRDTLQIHSDGSLTIMNVRLEHAGVYKLQIFNKSMKKDQKEFNISVVSAPETLSDSLCSQCVHQCSVMNLTRVTLSWNSSSSCAFVEVKYQDSSSSCVVNNSIRDETEHCQRCSDSGVSPEHTALETALLVALVALVTLVVLGVAVVAVLLYKKRKAGKKEFAYRYENGTVSTIDDHSDESGSSRNNEEP